MTKDKFRELCEQVLIPLLGNLMFQQQASLHETLDIIAQESVRVRDRLDRIAASIPKNIQDADNR
jgi:hypothetical protein